MKEIKAIIQPFMAERVLEALRAMPELPGVTVSHVRGFGKGRATATGLNLPVGEVYGVSKLKLEIVVPDQIARKVTQLIIEKAHTGNPGDGKIFISTVDEAVGIRTGEKD